MKKMVFLSIGVMLLSLSCVIPEKFICKIDIDKQGAYSVDFRGTLLFWAALEEIRNQGKVSSETDRQIKTAFEEWLSIESTIKKYEYRNSGRVYVEYYEKVTDGTSLDLSESFGMPLIIDVDSDMIIITERATGGEEIAEFVKLGYKLDGVIEITSELPIIDASGQKTGNKFMLFGPKMIRQVWTTFPTQDVIIKIGKK
jgi:hypothetical protein